LACGGPHHLRGAGVEEGKDFGEVLDSWRGFRAGGDVEGGGADGLACGAGVLRSNAAGEDQGKVGVGFQEGTGGGPVDGPPGAAVEAGSMGVEEETDGSELAGFAEVVGSSDAEGFDKGIATIGKAMAVFRTFVAVKLCEVNEIIVEETADKVGTGIDEDAHAENAAPDRSKDRNSGFFRAIALGMRPEVDTQGGDAEVGETRRIVGEGDAADLEGGRGRIEESLEDARHQGSLNADGTRSNPE
jgi:hypothetical protein